MSFSVAVLISGEGTNLQALLEQVHGRNGIAITSVCSSNSEAHGLERAKKHGIESRTFSLTDYPDRLSRDNAIAAWLERGKVDLLVLAGFMEVLTEEFVDRYKGRIINVHPALLPSFPGTRAIEQALDYGVKVGGVTVHFVNEQVDGGPIILQEALQLTYHRDVATIQQHIHEIEHRLLSRAVQLIAEGKVHLDSENPRLVHVQSPDEGEVPGSHGTD